MRIAGFKQKEKALKPKFRLIKGENITTWL